MLLQWFFLLLYSKLSLEMAEIIYFISSSFRSHQSIYWSGSLLLPFFYCCNLHWPQLLTITFVAQVDTHENTVQAYHCLPSFFLFIKLPLDMAYWFQLFSSNCCCLRDYFSFHSLVISKYLLSYYVCVCVRER